MHLIFRGPCQKFVDTKQEVVAMSKLLEINKHLKFKNERHRREGEM